MISVTEQLIQEYDQPRMTFDGQKEFFKDKRFETILTKIPDMMTTLYYWMSVESSNTMIKTIDSDADFLVLVFDGLLVSIGLIFLLGRYLVDNKIGVIVRSFDTVLLAMPLKLIENNLELTHHLKRVKKGERLW